MCELVDEKRMKMGWECQELIYIDISGLNGFKGRLGWMLESWKTGMLFQKEKSVLPGTGDFMAPSLFFFDKRLCNLFQTFYLFITFIT